MLGDKKKQKMASKLHNQQGKLVHVDLSTAYNFSTKKEGVWGQWGHCLVLIRALAETLHLMTGDGIFKRTHWAKNPESQSVLIGPLLIGSLFMLCKYVKKGGGARVVWSLCFPLAHCGGECDDGSTLSPSVTPFFFYLSWQLHAQHSPRECSPGCCH